MCSIQSCGVVFGFALASIAAGPAFGVERVVPDAYPNIQAALDASLDGDVVKVRAGTYFEALAVSKRVTLSGYGSDTVIVDALGGNALTIIGDGALVKKMQFQNAMTGIMVDEADGVTISECEIRETSGRGIYLIGARAVRVEDNEIDDAGSHGIGSVELEGGWIRNNRIRDIAGVGIRVMGAEIVVEDNKIVRSGSHGIQLGDSAFLDTWSRRALVRGNEIEDAGAHGIYFDAAATDGEATENVIESPAEFGIQIGNGADRNTLARNEITYAVEGIGVLGDGARLIENTIKHCEYGIGLAPSSNDCLVFGNKANKNSVWGLYLDGVDHSVTGNTAKNNGTLDAFVAGSLSDLDFAGNEFTTANF